MRATRNPAPPAATRCSRLATRLTAATTVALLALGATAGIATAKSKAVGKITRTPAADATPLKVTGKSFEYLPDKISIAAGEPIALTFNAVGATHDLYIAKVGMVVEANAGQTKTAGFTITKPGKYQFWCTLPQHKSYGMEGTLTVTKAEATTTTTAAPAQ